MTAALITDERVLVVDTRMHPDDAESLLAAIRTRANAPIRYVVNSVRRQHLWDRFGSGLTECFCSS